MAARARHEERRRPFPRCGLARSACGVSLRPDLAAEVYLISLRGPLVYLTLQRRMSEGECTVIKVPDAAMPADFLTKWIPNAKLEASLRYACNAHGTPAAVAASHPPAEGRASDSE